MFCNHLQPADQKKDTTTSDLELGMPAISSSDQAISDDLKVTEEVSQNAFTSLTIESIHANV